jgi:hypothetical protein
MTSDEDDLFWDLDPVESFRPVLSDPTPKI